MKAKWKVNPSAAVVFDGLDSGEVEKTFLGLNREFKPEDEQGGDWGWPWDHDDDDDGEGLPAEFDARTHAPWSHCASLLNLVRDQSKCGSCWAFSATSSFNDRLCIATGRTEVLGEADVMSCCSSCGDGCEGGFPGAADRYFVENGAVTGGLYNSGEGCYPYPFPHCAHHVNTPKYTNCMNSDSPTRRKLLRGDDDDDDDDMYDAPQCTEQCTNGSLRWEESKRMAGTAQSYQGKNSVKRAMVEHGPVSATFTVYKDFLLYSKGVYQKTSDVSVGGHAVKCFGYGEEDGVEYVLCANSWNETWGDEGFFKIDWNDLDDTFYAVEM